MCACVSIAECARNCTDRMCVRFEHLSSAPLKVSGGVRVEVRELEGRLEVDVCVCECGSDGELVGCVEAVGARWEERLK